MLFKHLNFVPNDPNEIPSIIVSGDDGGFIDILTPTNVPFQYNQTRLCQYEGSVGLPALDDVNGDGLIDLFVPGYVDNQIQLFSVQKN